MSCVIANTTFAQKKATISAKPKVITSPKKDVVYQVFTRLFGNKNTTNKPWGTIEENGVGKFNDFTDKALQEIKKLGVTYIWYTGVPHHDVIRDYTKYGISNDDPDVVKGRAGSPYAVKDYYNVNPDLAVDPSKRLEEFEALINEDMDLIFRFSPTTDDILNKVYDNYSDLYGNDINFYRRKMSDKQFYEGKLTKEKILDELRDRKYWQKNTNMKRPERIPYNFS